MIGQSGRTVHPKLYIGIGISGQMHHMVGIKGGELLVGINEDPKAPIFEFCDLGLVGDFRRNHSTFNKGHSSLFGQRDKNNPVNRSSDDL